MGRSSALKFADITCQFPDVHPVLTGLCEIAHIAELNAEEMYLRKSESLQLLYIPNYGNSLSALESRPWM